MTSHFPNDNQSGSKMSDNLYDAQCQFSTDLNGNLSDFHSTSHRQELCYLQETNVSPQALDRAHSRARIHRTNISEELIFDGALSMEDHFRDVAARLGVQYFEYVGPDDIIGTPSIDVLLTQRGPVRIEHNGQVYIVLSPTVAEYYQLAGRISDQPELRSSFAIAHPNAVRHAIWQLNNDVRVRHVVRALPDAQPSMSAQTLLTGTQGFLIGMLVSVFSIFAFSSTYSVFRSLHLFLSLIYLSYNFLKFAAILFPKRPTLSNRDLQREAPLPVYTVLVALYQEADLAEQIVQSMSRLNWPKSKLDIKLICEADDHPTISALEAARPGPQFEIIKVPDYGPRTKPKALQYALTGARGEYLTVYDAEDIPHPDQLLEAYLHFQLADEDVACLQAPLVISNIRNGWLPALFGLEYAGLFRRLLPLLAGYRLPIPLGGTSNHFRKSILKEVGGWDPCNVTEDADLGIRLYRNGFRTDVLKRPTIENAPEEKTIWIKQRTRWLKGWIQTWFVLMRNPVQVMEHSGILGFVIMQILIMGMLIAAIAHPLMYYFVFKAIILSFHTELLPDNPGLYGLFAIDIFNLVGGYLIFAIIGWKALIKSERRDFGLRQLLYLPYYWLLMSYAGWRAISQLPKRAQFWEKTPHKPVFPKQNCQKHL